MSFLTSLSLAAASSSSSSSVLSARSLLLLSYGTRTLLQSSCSPKRYTSTPFFDSRSSRQFTSTTDTLETKSPSTENTTVSSDGTSAASSILPEEALSLNISYMWDKSPNPHSLIVKLHPTAKHISLDQLMAILVQDKQNISMIHNVKYYKESLNGYVNLPQELDLSKLKGHGLKLLLEREHTKHVVIGPRFSYDINAGLIWDTLNPNIRSKFFAGGRLSRQRYLGDIRTIGLKVELAARLQAAFLIRPPWASLFFHEPIELGSGLDIATPGFNLTWASFKHSPGGLLCFGVPIGLTLGFSIVRGGTLIPVSDPENTPIPPRALPVNDE